MAHLLVNFLLALGLFCQSAARNASTRAGTRGQRRGARCRSPELLRGLWTAVRPMTLVLNCQPGHRREPRRGPCIREKLKIKARASGSFSTKLQ
eukprot:3216430-Pyramimonas_sp.AAC.1